MSDAEKEMRCRAHPKRPNSVTPLLRVARVARMNERVLVLYRFQRRRMRPELSWMVMWLAIVDLCMSSATLVYEDIGVRRIKE